MWETLSESWRVCVELAWEAYRAGSLPIGAVVADAEGRVPSRGRNRILETSGPSGTLFDNRLAQNMNEGQAPASAVLQFVDREVDGAT